MTLAYLCIVISIFIPIFSAGYAKLCVKGYSNRYPREFLSKQTGPSQRANWAQQNFYETFPAFAVGVVVAHQMQAVQQRIDLLAVTYVVMRCLYAVFYITDKSTPRSIVWAIAFISIISLYFIGA